MSLHLDNDKTKILLLASTPDNTASLKIDEEYKLIKRTLNYSANLDRFELIQEGAVTVDDLYELIENFRPNIIHFSGHGSQNGIYLEDKTGNKKLVEGASLANLFSHYSSTIQCVILNSCYSENQAFTISQSIPYVIGTTNEIKDSSAINFSIGFYTGIKTGSSIEESFELGIARVSLAELSEKEIPMLLKNGERIRFLYQRKENISRNNIKINKKLIISILTLIGLAFGALTIGGLIDPFKFKKNLEYHESLETNHDIQEKTIQYLEVGKTTKNFKIEERGKSYISSKGLYFTLYCSDVKVGQAKAFFKVNFDDGSFYDIGEINIHHEKVVKISGRDYYLFLEGVLDVYEGPDIAFITIRTN